MADTLLGDSASDNAIAPEEARARSFFNNTEYGSPKPPGQQLPETVRELRAEPARRVFSAKSMFGDAVKLDEVPVEATPEQRAAIEAANSEFLEICADLELSGAEANELVGLLRQATQEPPTAEHRSGWAADARAQLLRAYGDDAPEALALAKKLVARDPRAAAFLDASGLGNHPKIVQIMCEKARSQASRGRLKVK